LLLPVWLTFFKGLATGFTTFAFTFDLTTGLALFTAFTLGLAALDCTFAFTFETFDLLGVTFFDFTTFFFATAFAPAVRADFTGLAAFTTFPLTAFDFILEAGLDGFAFASRLFNRRRLCSFLSLLF
jgi:hypothetical protein